MGWCIPGQDGPDWPRRGRLALAYALWEARQYKLRSVRVEVLPPGARPIRVLQLTDLHLTPRQTDKMAWVHALADLNRTS